MLRLLTLLLFTTTILPAQGIEFFEGSWPEALIKAEAEDKLIFVDAYAEWCGPCKVMSARVFPDEQVGDYFNANFISVKYDMEKAESAEFREYHDATAYPTLLFINSDNELVHRLVGARQSDQLLRDAAAALARTENIDKLKADYEAGIPGAAYKYVRALLRSGEPHLRVANDYLRLASTEISAPASLRLIFIATTEADSRLYDLLLDHRDAITALEGEAAYDQKARAAVLSTFDKAVEYRNEKLMATAVGKLALLNKDDAKRLESQGEFAMALAATDRKAVIKATKNYLKNGAAGDENRLRALFTQLERSAFIDYGEVIDLAVEAGTAAAELTDEGWRDYYRLARFLQERKRLDQALELAEKSLAGVADGPANYQRAVEGLVLELREAVK